jgi:hypothetical protein
MEFSYPLDVSLTLRAARVATFRYDAPAHEHLWRVYGGGKLLGNFVPCWSGFYFETLSPEKPYLNLKPKTVRTFNILHDFTKWFLVQGVRNIDGKIVRENIYVLQAHPQTSVTEFRSVLNTIPNAAEISDVIMKCCCGKYDSNPRLSQHAGGVVGDALVGCKMDYIGYYCISLDCGSKDNA